MTTPVGQDGHEAGAAAPAPASPTASVLVPASRSVTGRDETVWLHPEATIAIGMAGMSVFRRSMGQGLAVIEGLLSEAFLRLGVARWTFLDAEGDPEPVEPESVARLLPFSHGGLEVAEAADALYGEEITRPLAERLSQRSPTGPTGGTTPPTPPSGPTPQRPPSRSSRSTSEDGTASGVPAP